MIRIDHSQVSAFGDRLAQVPREMWGPLRREIRAAAGELAAQVKVNASWSSRIPGAVKTKTSFRGGKSGGVRVYVDRKAAPHARALEGTGGPMMFRHPVFGNRDVWADQPTQPFFLPAIRAKEDAVVRRVQSAIDEALRKA